MLDTAARTVYDADLDLFREQVRTGFAAHLTPHLDRGEEEGAVGRSGAVGPGRRRGPAAQTR